MECLHKNFGNESPDNASIAFFRGACAAFAFFASACLIAWWRHNINYLYLFTGIGIMAGTTEFLMARIPKQAQIIRRVTRISLSILLVSLALLIGVNFQFSGALFDIGEGVVTGALIQLMIARLLIPFVLGNAFCSRVCWDGAVFELFDDGMSTKKVHSVGVIPIISIIYMWCVGLAVAATLIWIFPALTPRGRSLIFIIENAVILTLAFPMARVFGKRAYCRLLCPFITISGIFSRFSLFKITPVNPSACTKCGSCDKACPMSIPVSSHVKNNIRVSNANCTLCERCVSACPQGCLRVSLPICTQERTINKTP